MYRQGTPGRVVISTAPSGAEAGAGAPAIAGAGPDREGGLRCWRLFKPCRHEQEDGLYAMLPPDYFPVSPSSKPLLVKVPAAGASPERDEAAVHFECIPAPRRPLQFFRQLYDGTFVRLPHNFPDECYEDETPPADRFYLNVDVDPQSLPTGDMSQYFTRLPDAFQRELRARVPGPTRVPLPHQRYVLRLGSERVAGGRYTEDCFEPIDTRLLRLERRPAAAPGPRRRSAGGGGGPIRARVREPAAAALGLAR
ncbi:virion protein V67 [Cervid alphaherpesvirus 1]|uniref:Virion protein V67 n=1 Tax=Cervid alphaherpesvirus 1 TaxID=79891 RepID=A0A455JN87_9ALPH|nr:virion protein V67 [Cervid alphaherpesvirus 1]AVT50714.1 virion protein V67 [Cervid alphaherpesvirus 1]